MGDVRMGVWIVMMRKVGREECVWHAYMCMDRDVHALVC